jgi:hypothetical protein
MTFGATVNRPKPYDRAGFVWKKSGAVRRCVIDRKSHEAAHRRKMAASSGELSKISSSRPMMPFCRAQNADSSLMPRASLCDGELIAGGAAGVHVFQVLEKS